jgi:hypothetical protein
MILGQVAERIDPSSAFKEHLHGREHSVEDVDLFLKEAIASMNRWKTRVGDHLVPEADPAKYQPTLSSDQFRLGYDAALSGLRLVLQESRNSQNQFLHGVYHFTLPGEFRDPHIRAGREFYVVFDRDVFQKVRDDEDLGIVRGQPIAVNLAGFGESFTDWPFQNATAAQAGASAFRVQAPKDWGRGSAGWLFTRSAILGMLVGSLPPTLLSLFSLAKSIRPSLSRQTWRSICA